jgi:hypothetical protein
MDPKALIMDGKIDAARAMLVDQIKKSPADVQARALLFQVLLLCGEWDKARRQLDIAAHPAGIAGHECPCLSEPDYSGKRASIGGQDGTATYLFPDIPEYSQDFFSGA